MIRIEIKCNEDQTVKCMVKVVEGEHLIPEFVALLTAVERIANDHKSDMNKALEAMGVDDEE